MDLIYILQKSQKVYSQSKVMLTFNINLLWVGGS